MYAIIIPVYGNEGSLPALIEQLGDVIATLNERYGAPAKAVFVVDGSRDRSEAVLRELLPSCGYDAMLIVHARNFGSFAAIRTGLLESEADYYGMIAADLQEPPELLIRFYEALHKGDAEVVIGVREGRDDPEVSRAAAGLYWRLYRRFVLPEIPPGGVDLFGCSRKVRDELLKLKESNTSLVAQLFWLGFKRREAPYRRAKRVHGKSAWTLRKKLKYLFDSVYAFTDLPIRLITAAGALGMIAAAAYGLVVLAARLFGLISDPGFSAIIVSVLFFGGLNAFAIGIVGGYAWRTYENTKARPLAVISERVLFAAQPDARVRQVSQLHE